MIAFIFATILGLLRLYGYKSAFYQAIAHLYVGGLIGGWWADSSRTWWLSLAISLTILEVVCFLMGV